MSAVSQPATPQINHITRHIITAAMKVHSASGPGLLESAYHACLLHELRKQGLAVASQVGLPVVYEGERSILVIASISSSAMPWLLRSSALRLSILFIRRSYSPTCGSAGGKSACSSTFMSCIYEMGSGAWSMGTPCKIKSLWPERT